MNTRFMGDAALLVEVADAVQAQGLRNALLQRQIPGLKELVPGQASLLIVVDPLLTDLEALATQLPVNVEVEPVSARTHEFSVVYDGEDLAEIAKRLDIEIAELIRRHMAPLYSVAFLGFAPGFPYLIGLDPTLRLPRRAKPRIQVPAGSVAMADEFTGIYPQTTPGGWHILGRCETVLFDAARVEPALLAPRDRVRFKAAL